MTHSPLRHWNRRAIRPVAVICMMLAGCAQQPLEPLSGAPDGAAAKLVVGAEEHSEVEHQDGSFLELVEQPDRVVLVEFWGPHCGPCLHLAPVLEEIARTYPDRVSVVKVDVESSANQQLALYFNVRAIPTMRTFVNGEPVSSIRGYMQADRLLRELEGPLQLLEDSRSGS